MAYTDLTGFIKQFAKDHNIKSKKAYNEIKSSTKAYSVLETLDKLFKTEEFQKKVPAEASMHLYEYYYLQLSKDIPWPYGSVKDKKKVRKEAKGEIEDILLKHNKDYDVIMDYIKNKILNSQKARFDYFDYINYDGYYYDHDRIDALRYYDYDYYGYYGDPENMELVAFDYNDRGRRAAGEFAGYDYYDNRQRNQLYDLYRSRKQGRNLYHRRHLQEIEGINITMCIFYCIDLYIWCSFLSSIS